MTDENTSGSLMDGIEFKSRRPVDADWSKPKRIAVGVLAGLLAVCAVSAGGWYAWQNRPVSLPATADQAIATIQSGRIDRLPADRQQQYFAEAARKLQEIPFEDWRDRFDADARDAIRRIMQSQFEEGIRQIARGEQSPQEVFASMMRGRGEGRRPGGGERGSGEASAEQNDEARTERRQQFASRLQNRFQNGDAQQTGLMGEFFMMMRAQREAGGQSGGGRPPRGG